MCQKLVSTAPELTSTAAEGVTVVVSVNLGGGLIAPESASIAPKPSSTTPEAFSTWGGYFSFTNQLGKTITKGGASHWTTDYGVVTIDLAGLADGETSLSKAFTTSTTNKDRWGFNATLENGQKYGVDEKDCGFETEDSGQTVRLQAIIAGNTKSFYISMPKSSDCSTSF